MTLNASPATETAELDAIVVGAGFAGLYQIHLLRDRLGLHVQGLEAGDGVGGTWYWNRYPGARCDSESHAYSYMFSPELHREWQWSERYPGHAEIRRYLEFVADRLDIKRSIRFNARVVSARFDDATSRWTVTTDDGTCYCAQFLVTAVGCLSTTNLPDIPGREDFAGRWYHTGEWPHESVDFTGLRVGQIGTGSTGIQSAPVIAEAARHLTVFQRTQNYSVPAHNAPLSETFKGYVRDNYDGLRKLMHQTHNGHAFTITDRSAFDVTPAEREAIYEKAWAIGGLQFRAVFRDIITDKAANATAAEFIKSKIRQIVKDPTTAEILARIDHGYAAKRPPIDTGYFETFNRDNVTLVDLRATPIERITPTGIRTTAEHYDLDAIVFATGFDAMTGALLRMGIQGRDGLDLSDAWHTGPRNYLGLQVRGFPNLFTITGPGSPSVLCNMPVPIEQHAEWISGCIAHLREKGFDRIEPTEAAVENWLREVDRAARATLLYDVSHSWYLGANVPGKPRVFMPYAGGMAHYRAICDDVARRGYDGFTLSRCTAPAA